jgi:site-specific DNA recombinase
MSRRSPSSQPERSGVYIGPPGELSPAGSYDRQSALPVAYDPFSPENQRRLNREAAERNGEQIPPEFYFNDYLSGRKDVYRPGFEGAIRALLDGQIKTLYVTKLDRLTRRGMAHIGTILDDLERVGGRIVFVAEGLDSSKPGARQIIAILAEQARAEADAISWRIGQWHLHNRRSGIWDARRPYGYLVENGRLRPHPEEAPIVRWMIEEFLGGATLRAIARQLNERGVKPPRLAIWYEEAKAKGHRAKKPTSSTWGYDTVRTILSQPAIAALASHKGQLVYDENGDLVFKGEGIATVGERARILAELERRSTLIRQGKRAERIGQRTGGGRPAKYLLTGFVRCGECGLSGQRWPGQKYGRGRDYYYCSGKSHGHPCRGSQYPAVELEDHVLACFRNRLATSDSDDPLIEAISSRWLEQTLPENEADRRVLEQAKDDTDARIADLYAARYERGEFHTAEELALYESMMHKLRAQRDAAEEALRKLGPRPTVDIGFLLDTELSEEGWEMLPLVRQRDLLRLAIQGVWIYSADEPLDQRAVVVFHDDDPPRPRGEQADTS